MMDKQEIAKGMTRGTWKPGIEHDIVSDNADIAQVYFSADCDYRANAESICNAINNTYGAGWDATKVPKAFEYLAGVAELCKPAMRAAIENFLTEAKF